MQHRAEHAAAGSLGFPQSFNPSLAMSAGCQLRDSEARFCEYTEGGDDTIGGRDGLQHCSIASIRMVILS